MQTMFVFCAIMYLVFASNNSVTSFSTMTKVWAKHASLRFQFSHVLFWHQNITAYKDLKELCQLCKS